VTALKLKNISQSSAKQRAGRAGRTNEGFCFRLYSKKQKSEFSSNKTPEMQNMALDTVVLRLKSLDI
jgi:HrpA-like RNA helicase